MRHIDCQIQVRPGKGEFPGLSSSRRALRGRLIQHRTLLRSAAALVPLDGTAQAFAEINNGRIAKQFPRQANLGQ